MERFTDLRFTIGLFFAIIGAILLGAWVWGSYLGGPPDQVEGIHLNLASGAVMEAFGLAMLLLSRAGGARPGDPPR